MRRGLLLIAAILCFLLPARNADAFKFGADETIHFLQDISLKGEKNQALYLGYRTKIQFFVAGLYLIDEGYVLGVKGESNRYYDMPSGESLADFQKRGLLPNPLPPYSLSIWDYIFGYSLWWGIAFTVAWVVFSDRLKKRKAAATAAAVSTAPPDASSSTAPPSTPVSGPPAA